MCIRDRDVHYVIEAHFDVTDKAAPGDNPGKFQDIVKRRIQRGQFYQDVYKRQTLESNPKGPSANWAENAEAV